MASQEKMTLGTAAVVQPTTGTTIGASLKQFDRSIYVEEVFHEAATTSVICTAGVGEIGYAAVALPLGGSGNEHTEALRSSRSLALRLAAAVCSPKCATLLRPGSNCTYIEKQGEPQQDQPKN
jgi:hypothetical protein